MSRIGLAPRVSGRGEYRFSPGGFEAADPPLPDALRLARARPICRAGRDELRGFSHDRCSLHDHGVWRKRLQWLQVSAVPTLRDLLNRNVQEADRGLYEKLDRNRVRCFACGHACPIPEGQAGVCKVRYNRNGTLYVPWG